MPDVDVDVVVVGAGPAGSAAALDAGPRRPRGAARSSGARSRAQEHVRRRGLPAHPRRARSRLVGGGARSSAGSPAGRRWCSPTTQALTVDFRTDGLGRAALQRRHRLPARLRLAGSPARPRPTARSSSAPPPSTGLLRDAGGAVVGVRTDRPDGDLTRPRRHRLRRRQLVPRQGGRPLRRRSTPANFTLGVKETLALPEGRHRRALRRARPRGRRLRDPRLHQGVTGGGFVYTNLDTLAVGVVLKLPTLAAQQRRPEEIIAGLKAPPGDRPAGRGRRAEGVLAPTSSPRPAGR